MKKISIMMPTYNDAETIIDSINSIIMQSYHNWELIIINDGSTDNTEDIIKKYIKEKDKKKQIRYIKQDNQDQLIALINGLNYVTGDYIYILHSDDLLYDEFVFDKAIKYFEKHKDIDGIIGDLTIIDGDGKITGKQKLYPYLKSKKVPPTELLWLGRNIYVDFAFQKVETFKKYAYENYLIWNKPFWLCTEDNVSVLNLHKVDFCLFKYRIYENNYANNEIGKLCLINGELRTATQLMYYYNIPCFKIQYFVYRVFCHLGLYKIFTPIYQTRETKNKYQVIEFILNKRYPEGYNNYAFLDSLTEFYKNNSDRIVDFDKIYNGNDPIYLGNNFRIFNKQLVANELPRLYNDMFKEMKKGFSKISVSEENKEKALNLIKFLCIYPFVRIIVKGEENE